MTLKDKVRGLANSIKVATSDVIENAGNKIKLHTPYVKHHTTNVVSDLIDGKLPELEAAIIAATRRVAPAIGTAVLATATIIRRKRINRNNH